MSTPFQRAATCKTAIRSYKRTSAAAFTGPAPDAEDQLLGFAPYIHTAPRRNSITPDRQRAFIAALAATGIVTQAARTIGASLEALYTLRNQAGAEGFAAAWNAALDRGVARLEDCALERAIQGEERVYINKAGEVAARWTRYDTSLITFFLRQRRADRFSLSGILAAMRPGHPVYDYLRTEWAREMEAQEPDIEDVRAEVLHKLAMMEQARKRVQEEGRDYDLEEVDLSWPPARTERLGNCGTDPQAPEAESAAEGSAS